nr:MAG TPA_asm: hypothetical protein [Caudoviricetes sp.]
MMTEAVTAVLTRYTQTIKHLPRMAVRLCGHGIGKAALLATIVGATILWLSSLKTNIGLQRILLHRFGVKAIQLHKANILVNRVQLVTLQVFIHIGNIGTVVIPLTIVIILQSF